jgi:hypothetical protein
MRRVRATIVALEKQTADLHKTSSQNDFRCCFETQMSLAELRAVIFGNYFEGKKLRYVVGEVENCFMM